MKKLAIKLKMTKKVKKLELIISKEINLQRNKKKVKN